jgi:transcription elongation factor Elf1
MEEAARFEPGMPITTVNLEHNIRILNTIVCTAQTHCKHNHASRLIDVFNKCPRSVNAVKAVEAYRLVRC